jgi:hypothetical protein
MAVLFVCVTRIGTKLTILVLFFQVNVNDMFWFGCLECAWTVQRPISEREASCYWASSLSPPPLLASGVPRDNTCLLTAAHIKFSMIQ